MGYQYQQLRFQNGPSQNLPEAEFRVGIAKNNELVLVLPNAIYQSSHPRRGFTAATVGIKHEITYNAHWLVTAETLLTPPSGSDGFGNDGLGAALNGIITYTFNSSFNLTFMFGATTQTESILSGGQRYSSWNPDLVLTYSATPKLNLYGEIYGQSKTSPHQGSGFNSDAGFLYLMSPNLTVKSRVRTACQWESGKFRTLCWRRAWCFILGRQSTE